MCVTSLQISVPRHNVVPHRAMEDAQGAALSGTLQGVVRQLVLVSRLRDIHSVCRCSALDRIRELDDMSINLIEDIAQNG